MPEQPIVPETPLQRLLVEQALALARHLEQAAVEAPPGQVLDRCETLTLDLGRQFLRDALTSALHCRIGLGEKKGPPPAPVPQGGPVATKADAPETS